MLSRLGLDESGIGQRRTWELSGGQKQGVATAAALALAPDVLVLDAVLTMLDPGALACSCWPGLDRYQVIAPTGSSDADIPECCPGRSRARDADR